jgi:hypothetical protein
MLIWGMGFYQIEEIDLTYAEKQRQSSRKSMAASRARRKAALQQTDCKEESRAKVGRPCKPSLPILDDQN